MAGRRTHEARCKATPPDDCGPAPGLPSRTLTVYTADGRLAIDNNASENALRRVAVGRKNWLFAGSDNGGRTAATLFSVIATCERHQVEPMTYLRNVLTRIAAMPINELPGLLPDRWKPPTAN